MAARRNTFQDDRGRAVLDRGLDRNASPTETVGAPGTAIYSGFIVEQERDSRITGREKYRTYSDILANTSIVAAGLRFFVNIIAKAGWSVVPPQGSGDAGIEMAERIEAIMHGMTTPWHRVVRRCSMGRAYGFSVQEWTMRIDDEGIFVYKDIEPRPQKTIERWDTDRTGTVLGIIQRSPQTQEDLYIPRGKCIYFVDDTLDDSPEGLGLFRHLVKPAKRLERYEMLEGWGYERDLRGTPVGRAPLAAIQDAVKSGKISAADAAKFIQPIREWTKNALKGKDTGIVLDSAPYRSTGEQQTPAASSLQYDIELLQGDGGPHTEIAAAIERLNREMARILGVEQLLLGSDGGGSFALSRDKSQSFGLLVEGTLKEVREVMESDFLDPLFELNGWDTDLKPELRTETVQYRDIEQITTAIKDLATAGAPLSPNDPAVNEIRSLIGISDQPDPELDAMIPQLSMMPELTQDEQPAVVETPEAEEETEE
jgi:hypothetical protein